MRLFFKRPLSYSAVFNRGVIVFSERFLPHRADARSVQFGPDLPCKRDSQIFQESLRIEGEAAVEVDIMHRKLRLMQGTGITRN